MINMNISVFMRKPWVARNEELTAVVFLEGQKIKDDVERSLSINF